MKLTASKTSTAGEMMLTAVNPNPKWQYSSDYNKALAWVDFEADKFSMLTDDPTLQEGQEVDREEYEVVGQYLSRELNEWVDTHDPDVYGRNSFEIRQILHRKVEKQVVESEASALQELWDYIENQEYDYLNGKLISFAKDIQSKIKDKINAIKP